MIIIEKGKEDRELITDFDAELSTSQDSLNLASILRHLQTYGFSFEDYLISVKTFDTLDSCYVFRMLGNVTDLLEQD